MVCFVAAPQRLSHFEIRIGDEDEIPVFNQSHNALCHYQEQYQPSGATVQYDCYQYPIWGRYVSITKSSASPQRYMTLCEVQVFVSCM